MNPVALTTVLGVDDLGVALHDQMARLYPLCRSATGNGVRDTLHILGEGLPMRLHEVPSGTQVLDWTVPREWNIRDAWVKDSSGRRVIDFKASNLHVVGYSLPVRCSMSLAELQGRLHSLPDKPDWIPYRNSFYREDWGFCMRHRDREQLCDDTYEVCIDSSLEDGNLSYAEVRVPGAVSDEVLIHSHICHPSLCNDNLSGNVVAACLARYLTLRPGRLSYRFVFAPATIGAITWLSRNEDALPNIRHGLVLSLLGDAGTFTYKRSRRGDAAVDRAASHVLAHRGLAHAVQAFSPYGYDERQFCSPGYDLPVGCLMRTPHGCFPEYHTSGDDLDFVRPAQLEDSVATCLQILEVLERDRYYRNTNPRGEPQLGRRGIYRSLAERGDGAAEMAMLWTLNLSDGHHSLLEIAERSGMSFLKIDAAAALLEHHGLLAPANEGGPPRSTGASR